MAGDSRLVTEYYLAQTYIPKNGHTPGSDNGLCLDINTITSRYYVGVTGIATSGRLPSQNQLYSTSAPPTVVTGTISYTSGVGADGDGEVTSAGTGTVSARGFCWNTTGNPTTGNTHTTNGFGVGIFTGSLFSLTCGIVNYARAYATSEFGTSYGSVVTFTPVDPTVYNSLGYFTDLIDLSGHTYTNGTQGWSVVDAVAVCNLYNSGQYVNGSVYLGNYLVDSYTVGNYIYSGAGSSYCISRSVTGYFVKHPIPTSIFYVVEGLISSIDVCGALPSVTTNAVTNIGIYLSTGGGSASGTITDKGICWNTTGTPNIINDNYSSNGAGAGSFTADITTFPSTTYYVRAYAINAAGTVYGNQVSFTSLASATTTTTSTTIAPVLIVATSSAMVETFNPYQLWARVYYTIDKDAYSYPYFTANHGINYTDFPTVPTILSPREWAGLMTYPGYDNDAFRYLNYSQLFPVINGNSYYVKAMVNLVNTENISDSTYYLSDYIYVHATSTPTTTTTTTAAPTTTTTTAAPTTTTTTTPTTTTTTTLPPLPSVSTDAITNIGIYSSTGGGSASGTITGKGICWNRTGTPTLDNADAYSSNGAGAGTFSASISTFPSTTYYVRAYATNASGTAYGNQVSFTSLAVTTTTTTAAPTTTTTTTPVGAGYYDCGYGCQYYSYNPGCTTCTPTTNNYIADVYNCVDGCGNPTTIGLNVSTSSNLSTGRYYWDSSLSNWYYISSTGGSGSNPVTFDSVAYTTCNNASIAYCV